MSSEWHARNRISTLHRPVSPPPARQPTTGSLSALEAGKESVNNHLATISAVLRRFTPSSDSDTTPGSRTLPVDAWEALYSRNAHAAGHHFVIHQHDHPVAGPHYDLRLQFSESSSLSWSVMYGLPGDANSRRLNRNATETRVHSLWNHLIETASSRTGSMIIWDTGEYEVLPDKPRGKASLDSGPETDTDTDESGESGAVRDSVGSGLTESEKLRRAFQNHKIHLRLHGTRLPKNYTIFLHRDKSDVRSAPTPISLSLMSRKRKRRKPVAKSQPSSTSNSESDTDIARSSSEQTSGSGKRRKGNDDDHSDAEGDNEVDYQIRLNNAYPGAVNDIGSIHQRRWFIVLDRPGSGFVPEKDSAGKRRWVRAIDKRSGMKKAFEPFYVRGPEVERSVVTARLGSDVLKDEAVEGFIPRRGWNPVLV
ncbi:DNA polymerase ligase-domain-containing protein [Aspergillus aurantiobrunneus]